MVVMHRAILQEIESQVEVMARGRRVYPFGCVVVTLKAEGQKRVAVLQGTLGRSLPGEVREMLEGSGCELPQGFVVEVRTAATISREYAIEYSAAAATPAAAAPAPPPIVPAVPKLPTPPKFP